MTYFGCEDSKLTPKKYILLFSLLWTLPMLGQDDTFNSSRYELIGDTITAIEEHKSSGINFQFTESGRYGFKILSDDQGLPINNVVSMCEDSRGYIWMGGQNGRVIRFDGSEIVEFKGISAFSGKSIMDIFEDSKGNLWFGIFGKGVVKYDGYNFIHFESSVEGGLPGERIKIMDIDEDHLGRVWIASLKNGIIIIENGTAEILDTKDKFNIESLSSIGRKDQQMWIGGYHRSVVLIDSENFNVGFRQEVSDSKFRVCQFLETEDGKTWAATSQGIYFRGEDQFEQFHHNGIPFESNVWSICIDDNKRLWAGGYKDGLHCFDESKHQHFSSKNGLNNDNIFSLLLDSRNVLWIGTKGSGVNRFSGEAFENYPISNKEEIPIWCSLRTNDNQILVGTELKGVYEFTDFEFTRSDQFEDLNDESVLTMYQDLNNQIWFGTETGAYCYGEDNIINYNASNALNSSLIRCFAETNDGKMCIGTSRGLTIIDGEEYILIDKPNGLLSHDVFHVTVDSENGIWIGTNEGLAYIHGSQINQPNAKVILINRQHGLVGSSINNVLIDSKDQIWIAAYGDGIVKTDRTELLNYINELKEGLSEYSKFEILNQVNGLVSDNIEGLIEHDNKIYIGSDAGVSVLFQKSSDQLSISNFSQKEGLREQKIKSDIVAIDSQGQLLWPTSSSLVVLNPDKIPQIDSGPKIQINGLDLRFKSVNWKDINSNSTGTESYWKSLRKNYIHYDSLNRWTQLPVFPTFSHDQNHMTFHFDANDWRSFQDLIYQYKIDGLDKTWLPPTRDNKFTHPSIPPGEYTFQVRAKNGAGFWSEPSKFKFQIIDPYWNTSWFMIVAALFTLGLIYFIFKIRIRALERNKVELEEKVVFRTKELAFEKEKSDNLLLNILPKRTAEELKETGSAQTRNYKSASVLFSDFSGFTGLTETMNSDNLVKTLDSFFEAFDKTSKKYNIEKIKTIGDSYMCAAGIPVEHKYHAVYLVAFGLEMIRITNDINAQRIEDGFAPWEIRIGINSGPLIAGVVGKTKFAYDVWGDTVNVASRMESSGEVSKLNISETTYNLVKEFFVCEARGAIDAKNKGQLNMYFVNGFVNGYAKSDNNRQPSSRFWSYLRGQEAKYL